MKKQGAKKKPLDVPKSIENLVNINIVKLQVPIDKNKMNQVITILSATGREGELTDMMVKLFEERIYSPLVGALKKTN
jgi:hypothetical protein